MFFGCKGFRYLYLPHIITPKVNSVNSMFKESEGLFYLNLFNFVVKESMDRHDIFLGLKQHCVYCINDTHTKELILPEGAYAFCSITCEVLSNFKIDFYNKRCLDLCEKSDNTKYDYKNVCYPNCPKNTLMLGYICIDTSITDFQNNGIEYDDQNKPIGYYQDTD